MSETPKIYEGGDSATSPHSSPKWEETSPTHTPLPYTLGACGDSRLYFAHSALHLTPLDAPLTLHGPTTREIIHPLLLQ